MSEQVRDLHRFLGAQNSVYNDVLRELRNGRKRTHWMWFIFPQIEGLGHSFMAKHYSIGGIEEAKNYLRHPILGGRLRECTAIVNGIQGRSAYDIFGDPDKLKFGSSMTLFKHASSSSRLFSIALNKYLGGNEDDLTLAILNI